MAYIPPFTVKTGDENPDGSGTGIMTAVHGPFPTIKEAEEFIEGLPEWKFWEIYDGNGKWVTQGYVVPKAKAKKKSKKKGK